MLNPQRIVMRPKYALSADGLVDKARSAVGLEPEEDHTVRNWGMGAAITYPLAVAYANRQGALPTPNATYDSITKLRRVLRPGDVIVTGDASPDFPGFKMPITAVTGVPDYQHVGVFHSRKDGQRRTIHGVQASPVTTTDTDNYMTEKQNIRVLRPKNEETAQRIIKHMELSGEKGRMYSNAGTIRAGLANLLVPNFISKRFSGGYRTGNGELLSPEATSDLLTCDGPFCSNAVATATPEHYKKNPANALPADVLHSTAYTTLGEYKPPREILLKGIVEGLMEDTPGLSSAEYSLRANKVLARSARQEALLRHSKTIAGLGLGLGTAGLIYTGSRLGDSDLSLGEGLAGAGLLAAGVSPFAAPFILENIQDSNHKSMLKDLSRRVSSLTAQGLTEEQAHEKLRQEAHHFVQDITTKNNIDNINRLNIGTSPTHRAYDIPGGGGITSYSTATPGRVNVSIDVPLRRSEILRQIGLADVLKNKVNSPTITPIGDLNTEARWTKAQVEEGYEAAKRAVGYARKEEGLRGALRTAKDLLPQLVAPTVGNFSKKYKVPAMLAGLGGAGLLGYNLLTDKKED